MHDLIINKYLEEVSAFIMSLNIGRVELPYAHGMHITHPDYKHKTVEGIDK
jgi:hypothetical protein